MNRTVKVIALAIPAAVSIALVSLFLNWTRNPYGLERERLGPRGNEKLPPITPVSGAANYLLFAAYQDNAFVIHLPIPESYFQRRTRRFIKSDAALVTMYYPAMHGVTHPANAHLLTCNGWCEGYMHAFITVPARGNDARAQDARNLKDIQNVRVGNNPLLRFENLDRAFGLDDHFEIRYPVSEEKSKGDKFTKEYLLKRDQNGEVQYLFKCSPYMPSPGCKVTFNLSSRPEILVDLSFGRHLMENWEDIISSVDRTITSWGPARVETVLEK